MTNMSKLNYGAFFGYAILSIAILIKKFSMENILVLMFSFLFCYLLFDNIKTVHMSEHIISQSIIKYFGILLMIFLIFISGHEEVAIAALGAAAASRLRAI